MKNKNYNVLTNQQLTNLIKAEEDRLTLINSCINGLYDNIGPFNETQETSLYHWYDEKREIENEIAEMKRAMKGTVSGSIKSLRKNRTSGAVSVRNGANCTLTYSDEYYTKYVIVDLLIDIITEVNPNAFRGKTVYCNCDCWVDGKLKFKRILVKLKKYVK